MAKIKLVHDGGGRKLTVWLDEGEKEHAREQVAPDVFLLRKSDGTLVGLEILTSETQEPQAKVSVQTNVKTEIKQSKT